MKQCPRCNRNYSDDALSYCLEDGAVLVVKYDEQATLINPYPPAPVVPPTVAYQGAPVTANMHAQPPPRVIPAPAPPRRSPWLVGLLVFLALGVGLTIGAIIFQRSGSSSTASPPDPGRDPVVTHPTTSTTVSSSPGQSPVKAVSPSPPADQKANTQEQECVLYNDKSDKTTVNVREDCDTRNCESDSSTIAGEYPDNTPIRVVRGSNVYGSRFTWVKVIIISSSRNVWVASSKIKCV